MARRLFFVEGVRRGHAQVSGEDAHHLVRVLRVEPGQRYEISDNESLYLAEVETARKSEVVFRVIERLEAPPPALRIHLLAALIKFDRFEWLIEKATELGVEAIVPVEAARSEKGLATAAARRLERWRKIAREASQQARRARLPSIEPLESFAGALARPAGGRYFLEAAGGVPALAGSLARAEEPLALMTGPEGGWTDAERAEAATAGWTPVSLGPNILRAETAAMAAVVVSAYARF